MEVSAPDFGDDNDMEECGTAKDDRSGMGGLALLSFPLFGSKETHIIHLHFKIN